MTTRLKMSPFIVMMLCILTACCVYAQDTPKSMPILESEISSDWAFDRYVDLDLIGKAVFSGDADLLTDTALQLASAERTLIRTHKSGITSEALLTAALNLATEIRDKDVLERLAKIAQSLNRKDLAGKVANAQKLASEPADAIPELMVSVKEMSPEDYAAFHQCLSAVLVAKITNDATWLQDWETKYGCQADDSQHYIYLKTLITKTLAELPKAEGVSRNLLSKLAEESRGNEPDDRNKPGDWNRPGDKPGDWNRPGDKPGDWNRPGDKPGDWNRPGDKPGDWNRPGDKPGDWNRPGDRPGDWNRPGDKPGDWNRPGDRPGDWNRPGDKPGDWNRPGDRPGDWNRPGDRPGKWHRICPICRGAGSTQLRCASCQGTGRRHLGWLAYRCSRCGGDGLISRPCIRCNGTGLAR